MDLKDAKTEPKKQQSTPQGPTKYKLPRPGARRRRRRSLMKLNIYNVHYGNSPRISTYSLKGSFGEPAAGSTSPSASTRPREFVLGGTLGRRLLILGLRFGALEVHFDVLLWPWGRTLDLFFGFSRKVSKKVQKRSEKRS